MSRSRVDRKILKWERGALEEIAEVTYGDMCSQLGYWAAEALKPYGGEPGCSDCETMTHCETHHKVEGLYPEPRTTPARKDG